MKHYVMAGLMLLAGAAGAAETSSEGWRLFGESNKDTMNMKLTPRSESKWKLSLGVTHRSFGDIDFKQLSLGSSSSAGFVRPDGIKEITAVAETGTLVVKGIPTLGPDGSLILHSGASVGSIGSKQLDGSTGLVLGASKDFVKRGNLTLSLDLSLSYVKTDISPSVGGDLSALKYAKHSILNKIPGSSSENDIYFFNPNPTSTTSSMAARIDYDLDLRLYTMGLGLGGRMSFGPVDLKVSAGPSLTIARHDASVSTMVTPAGGGASSSTHMRDRDIDFLLGIYASVELECQLNDSVAMSLGYRYDVMQEVDTMIGDVDPSGGSAELKLTYSF